MYCNALRWPHRAPNAVGASCQVQLYGPSRIRRPSWSRDCDLIGVRTRAECDVTGKALGAVSGGGALCCSVSLHCPDRRRRPDGVAVERGARCRPGSLPSAADRCCGDAGCHHTAVSGTLVSRRITPRCNSLRSIAPLLWRTSRSWTFIQRVSR